MDLTTDHWMQESFKLQRSRDVWIPPILFPCTIIGLLTPILHRYNDT